MSGAPDPGDRLWSQAPRLRLLLSHLAGPALLRRVEIDDLVQETLLRALADPERVPPAEAGEAALARWLGALARHAVGDAVRAARARKRDGVLVRLAHSDWSAAGPSASRIAAAGSGPATRAQGRELASRVEAAFRALPPDQRRVVGLRQLEGLPATEVARRMGRSEAAVHSLYRRALLAWEQACGASFSADSAANRPRAGA